MTETVAYVSLADAARILGVAEQKVSYLWTAKKPRMPKAPRKIGHTWGISPSELSTIAGLLGIDLSQRVGPHRPEFDPLTSTPRTEFQGTLAVLARLDVLIELMKEMKDG